MSTLSTETTRGFLAVLYNENDERIKTGIIHYYRDDAEREAKELIEYYVEQCGKFYYAEIKDVIMPIYK